MLQDRSYMRQSPFTPQWSATMILLISNVVCFVLQEINSVYGRPDFVPQYLALSSRGLGHGYVWQLLTFQFLHGNLLHLLLNCLCLYMFGRTVEEAIGKRHYLKLYFASGVLGGLCQILLGWIWPRYFGASVVGASAGLYGLIAAFTMLHPEGIIFAWFVIPIRAKYMLMIAAGISLFYILVPANTQVAHAAHLGGILGGLGYVYLVIQGNYRHLFARAIKPSPRRRELVNVPSAKQSFWQKSKPVVDDDLPATDFISKEVDPILDKISAHGIHSLTTRERQILEMARARMGKR